MAYQIGIDLGTSFTAVAVARDHRVEVVSLGDRAMEVPSVAFLREDGVLLLGDSALRRSAAEPTRFAREFKRRLGDPTPILLGGIPYSTESLMSAMLRYVIDEVSEREGGPPERATLTFPANWGPFKRELFERVRRVAGVSEGSTVSEPEAAAIHFSSTARITAGRVIALYDLGGGTFDAAVLRKTVDGFEPLGVPKGIEHLGGVDFDEAVFGYVTKSLGERFSALDRSDPVCVQGVARLRRECIEAKETLSSDTEVAVAVALPGLHTTIRLTRREFEELIHAPLLRTVEALDRAVSSALVPREEVTMAVLAGGSSRIPLIAELIQAELHLPVAISSHPKYAVALGAAQIASLSLPSAGHAHVTSGGRRVERPESAVAHPPSGPSTHPEEEPHPAEGEEDRGPAQQPKPPAEASAPAAGPVYSELGRAKGGTRAKLFGVLAVTALVVGGVAWLTSRDNRSNSPSASSTSEARPFEAFERSNEIVTLGNPIDLEVVGTDLWVMSEERGVLQRFDTTQDVRKANETVDLGFSLSDGRNGNDIIVNNGSLYVTQKDAKTIALVDLRATPATVTRISVPGRPVDGTVLGDTVWVSLHPDVGSTESASLLPIDGETVGREVPMPAVPYTLLAINDELWVTLNDVDKVARVDPASGEITAEVALAGQPIDMLEVGEFLWVSLHDSDQVAVVDRETLVDRYYIPVGLSPHKLVAGFGSVWVSNSGNGRASGSVSRLNSVTREALQAPLTVGLAPIELAVGAEALYVANYGSGTVDVLTPRSPAQSGPATPTTG